MTADITKQFNEAAATTGSWTDGDVRRVVKVVATEHPGARVDWEPGDEEWARVIELEGDGIIAVICAKIPLGFIRGSIPPRVETIDFTWISVKSTGDAVYRVDPEVLARIFGRPVSQNLNYEAVSIDDIWWATVS